MTSPPPSLPFYAQSPPPLQRHNAENSLPGLALCLDTLATTASTIPQHRPYAELQQPPNASTTTAYPQQQTHTVTRPLPAAPSATRIKHKPTLLPRIIFPRQFIQSPSSARYPPTELAAALHTPTTPGTPPQTNVVGHKRRITASDINDINDHVERNTNSYMNSCKRTLATRRKPTYLVRKDERDALRTQVQQLQAQVDTLHKHTNSSASSSAWSDHNHTTSSSSSSSATQQQQQQQQQHQHQHQPAAALENRVLREVARNQQLALVRAQSIVSELLVRSNASLELLDTPLRLDRDWSTRRAQLVALKAQKLHDAQQLLAQRMQWLDADPTRDVAEDARSVNDSGDFCSVTFRNAPLVIETNSNAASNTTAGIRSSNATVQQVYDTLRFHMQHMERSLRDAIGTVVTSDSDANGDNTILQRRLVYEPIGRDVAVESNFVVFSEFVQDRSSSMNSKGDVGVFVLTTVDQDELFPYCEHECVRRDVSGIILVHSVPRKASSSSSACTGGTTNSSKSSSSSNAHTNANDHVVVITQWLMLRLRHNSALQRTSANKVRELRANIHAISDAMMQTLQTSGTVPVITA